MLFFSTKRKNPKRTPKEDATISGYDPESSLRHVHCPRCGKNNKIPS